MKAPDPVLTQVLDRRTGALLASHYFGGQEGPYNPYNWTLLSDGKLAIGTSFSVPFGPPRGSPRAGLYVALDATTRSWSTAPARFLDIVSRQATR